MQDITFDSVYQAYGGRILNLAFRMTGSEDTARDMTQDVFLKVYERLDTFQQKSDIYTWIYRIATNHILNHLKKMKRQQLFSLLDKNVDELLREGGIDSASENILPDQMMEKSERENFVWNAILDLPVKYRMPLVLFRYENMSYKEIAEKLDLSLSAVESRIHRANKQLIKKLEPLAGHI